MDYPRPKWLPELPVNIDKMAEKVAYFTENKKPFVLFKNGTCIFPSFVGEGMDDHCLELLEQVVNQSPDFNVSRMNEGSYLVTFTRSVYSVILDDEYEMNRGTIIKAVDAGGLLPGENVLLTGDREVPKDHYYIGLFARARLYRDVAEKVIAKHVNTAI